MGGSNYLISLRNDAGKGSPGKDVSSTSYIKINASSSDYNLIKNNVDSSTFAEEIKAIANGGPIIIFIHGYHNDSAKIVTLHKDVKAGLVTNFKTDSFALISFDWPTNVEVIGGYKHDWTNAQTSGPRLINDCINFLISSGIPSNKIHVLTHSMGGRVAEVAFESTPPLKPIGHVMLTAADVDATHYDVANNSTILTNFVNYSSSLTCYHSSFDKAMILSSKQFNSLPNHGAARLGGETGINENITNQLEKCSDVDCSKYYQNNVKAGIEISHTWYLKPTTDVDFMKDIHSVLTNAKNFPTRASIAKGRFSLEKSSRK